MSDWRETRENRLKAENQLKAENRLKVVKVAINKSRQLTSSPP